jgi:hypothetical protein
LMLLSGGSFVNRKVRQRTVVHGSAGRTH